MDSITNTSAQALEQQPIIVQSEAPWFQMNGEVTPTEYLKTLTSSWDAQTWERYLSWFEERSSRTSETLLPPRKYDKLCDELEESIFVNSESGADKDLRARVAEYLLTLTDHQRRILELIFWDGRSERYVAQQLGIKQSTVHTLKKRAFKKIRALIEGVCRLPYMRGPNSSHVKGGSDEQDVSLAEAS